MIAIRLSLALVAASTVAGVSQADEAARHRNVLVVTVEGLAEVGVPARGLDEILPDAEIHARVTPNCERHVAMGTRFGNVFGYGDLGEAVDALEKSETYRAKVVVPEPASAPDHEDIAAAWTLADRQRPLRRWARRMPADRSVAGWEALAASRHNTRLAISAADALKSAASEKPLALFVEFRGGSSPVTTGVFFDRFPLDQIELPADPYDRRLLAARMGIDGASLQQLDAAAELQWKQAIQAWLAQASEQDYALGMLVDAIEELAGDDDPTNDWKVLLAASSLGGHDPSPPSNEIASRADLVVVLPGESKRGQVRTTPIDLSTLPSLVSELAGIETATRNHDRVLPLLEPAGDRYDRVAITSAAGFYGVRSHRFRLVAEHSGPQQLFDLSKDPAGFTDLLDPNNAPSVEKFGLSDSQVESVRKWLAGELTHHLIVDQGDGDRHRSTIASLKQAGISPKAPGPNHQLTGDYNRDGVVNAADKTVWAGGLGEEVEHPGDGADGNHDGRVTQEDDEVWRANYGRRAG